MFGFWIINNDVNISQLATKGIQHVPRNTQHATRNTQLATHYTQLATHNMLHPTRTL